MGDINKENAAKEAVRKTEESLLYQARSAEAQDIVGRMPSWIIRYGITIIAVFIMILFAGAGFMKYPDLIIAEFNISISDSPQKLFSKKTGRIAKLFIKEGDVAYPGNILAILENPSDIYHVMFVKNQALSIDSAININRTSFPSIDTVLRLGSLQSPYQDLLVAINDYKYFTSSDRAMELKMQQLIRQNAKLMLQRIENWEETFLIKSTVNGEVAFLKPLHEQLDVKEKELLMVITPPIKSQPFVTGFFRHHESGKVKAGQVVSIKLDAYPYQEYGSIKGVITKLISLDTGYVVNARLVNGLTTSNGFRISSHSVLSATGEIIINDKTVLRRLFDKISP